MIRKAAAARMAAAVSAGASILALTFAGATSGCYKYDDEPFNPREMSRASRLAARERTISDKEPIPTTMQARPSTRPDVRSQTTEFVGDDPVVRMGLQEIIQRTVAHNAMLVQEVR